MALETGSLLLLMLLGGVVALDGTSFGQFMVSRPFVAATLAGWIVGDPVSGAAIGLVLEAFHLTVLPVGAARYPEGGPAAVAGGAVFATSNLAPSTMVVTVLVVLLLEWAGGESIRVLRQINIRIITLDHRAEVGALALEKRHLSAVGLDFLRGILLVLAGIALLSIVSRYVLPHWGFGEDLPQMLLVALVAGLIASATRLVGWRAWFAVAGAAGTVAMLLLTG